MSMKNMAIGIGALLVLGGLWWLATLLPAARNFPSPQSTGEDQAPANTTTGDRHYDEKTDLYSIDITYPASSNAVITARIESIVKEEVDRFKAENVSLIDDLEAQRIREQGRPYELVVAYKPYTHKGFTSYEFDRYLDTGGAHPNAFFRTVTFNQAGEEVPLAGLFTPGIPYLARLSSAAYTKVTAELTKRAGSVTPEMEDTVRVGTAPSPEAIQFFYLKSGELHLLFPPYQVAAYAAGSFDIAIPLTDLQDILKQDIL